MCHAACFCSDGLARAAAMKGSAASATCALVAMVKRAAPKVQAKPKQAAVEEDGEEALLKTGEGWEAVKDAVQSLKAAGQWHSAGRGSRQLSVSADIANSKP